MADRVFNRDLVEDGTIIQLDGNGVSYRPLLGVVIIGGEAFFLDTSNLGTEGVNSRVSSGRVSAIWESVTGGGK